MLKIQNLKFYDRGEDTTTYGKEFDETLFYGK